MNAVCCSGACRKHAITKELAIQVTHLAGDLRTYEERVYKILCGCYEIYPQEELLIRDLCLSDQGTEIRYAISSLV